MRLTVAMGTVILFLSQARLKSRTIWSRSEGVASIGTQIVVMQIDAPCAYFRKQRYQVLWRNRFPHRISKWISRARLFRG